MRSREAHFACPNRRACSQATSPGLSRTLYVLSLHAAIAIGFLNYSAHDMFNFDNSVYLAMAV